MQRFFYSQFIPIFLRDKDAKNVRVMELKKSQVLLALVVSRQFLPQEPVWHWYPDTARWCWSEDDVYAQVVPDREGKKAPTITRAYGTMYFLTLIPE